MKTAKEPKPGCFADVVQMIPGGRLRCKPPKADLILCRSSGFREAPDISMLEALSPEQEELLLRTKALTVCAPDGHEIDLQFIDMGVAIAAMAIKGIEIKGKGNLPVRLQLWTYDRAENCVYPNLPNNTVFLRAEVTVSMKPRIFPLSGNKVTVQGKSLKEYPDGFLCYEIGDYEYPIPNRLFLDARKPFVLDNENVTLRAAEAYRDMISVRIVND